MTRNRSLLAGILAVVFLIGCTRPATITIEDAWVRQPPPGAGMTAGYARITNRTDSGIVITGARAQGYGLAEIHRTVIDNGVARMRHVEKLAVKPGEAVVLEPGGLHLMLMRPETAPGDSVAIELVLDDGSRIAFDATVRMPGTPNR